MRFSCSFLVVSIARCATKPNLIIFLADSLGYNDVGYNGHPTIQTPHIDKLSFDGIIFSQSYSGSSYISSSIASILTGRLPIRYGLGDAIPNTEITLAHVLKQIEYKTMFIGQWNLGKKKQNLPTNLGFDHYFGVPLSYSSPNNHTAPLALLCDDVIIEQPVDLSTLTQRYVHNAIRFIRTQQASHSPFLLFIVFNPIHSPWFIHSAFCNVSRRGIVGDAIAQMDSAIGSIMDSVNDNTLTVFSSSSGAYNLQQNINEDGCNGLFRDGKGTCWDGAIRVPFIAHWNGVIKPETRSMQVMTTYDIFMTVLSVVDAVRLLPTDRVYDSMDISYMFDHKDIALGEERCVLCFGGDSLWSMRCGHTKVHWFTRDSVSDSYQVHDPPLLFNIDWDPSEKHPIFMSNDDYQNAVENITLKAIEFNRTLHSLANQSMQGITDDALCCDWKTNCICNESNLKPFECRNTIAILEKGVDNTNTIVFVFLWIVVIAFVASCLCVYKNVYKQTTCCRYTYHKIPDPV